MCTTTDLSNVSDIYRCGNVLIWERTCCLTITSSRGFSYIVHNQPFATLYKLEGDITLDSRCISCLNFHHPLEYVPILSLIDVVPGRALFGLSHGRTIAGLRNNATATFSDRARPPIGFGVGLNLSPGLGMNLGFGLGEAATAQVERMLAHLKKKWKLRLQVRSIAVSVVAHG